MTSISLTLDLFDMRLDCDDASASRCPRCRRPLTLHQPDPDRPDRLVATCEGCRNWFIINTATGLMARLPDDQELRDADITTSTGREPDTSAPVPSATSGDSHPSRRSV
jgi:hypothetical protein